MLNFNKKINLINHVTFQQENISNKPFSTHIKQLSAASVAQFLVLCVVFLRSLLVILSFFFITLVLSALFLYNPCIVCPFSLQSLYCLPFFFIVLVLSALFLYSPCIVCPFSLQPLYCLSFFFIVLVLSVLFLYNPCIVCPFSL